MEVHASTLLALPVGGWVSNFQKKSVTIVGIEPYDFF